MVILSAEPRSPRSSGPEMPLNENVELSGLSVFDMETACLELSFALNSELDRIGFPGAPERTGRFADALLIDRTAAYRILKGLAEPTFEQLLSLKRQIGISIDLLVDASNQKKPDVVPIRFAGVSFPAVISKVPLSNSAIFFGTTSFDGHCNIETSQPGSPLPENAFGIGSITFLNMPSIAVLDDDSNILNSISEGLSSSFRVVTFSYAKELLHFSGGLSSFTSLIIDWNLPDFNGPDLIARLREMTKASIFILTGDPISNPGISEALQYPNVHYVQKPVGFDVLSKRIFEGINSFSLS